MKWIYDDGGRSRYFKGFAGDCAIRAVAIASGEDYKKVYNEFKDLNDGKSCRDGTPPKVTKKYMKLHGWKWQATMGIGTGCRVHLKADELPGGVIIARVTGHIVCVKDGVIYDTHDCSRRETRCVYGYWYK